MPWNDKAFCERVKQRCAELGRNERDVLRKAGLAHDYLLTNPRAGRRVPQLERLAAELDWSLADILGLGPSAVSPYH